MISYRRKKQNNIIPATPITIQYIEDSIDGMVWWWRALLGYYLVCKDGNFSTEAALVGEPFKDHSASGRQTSQK